jgi:hypothetical protein
MFYVNIQGISDEQLAFLGFRLVKEDEAHKLYADYYGEEYLVRRDEPYLKVDDLNTAMSLGARMFQIKRK